MATGLCGTCRVVLAEGNCFPSCLKKGFGLCRKCDVVYDKLRPNRIRFCSNEKCGIQLTEDSCYPSTLRRGGLCKLCSTKRNKDRYWVDPQKSIAKVLKWRKDNPERQAAIYRKGEYGVTKEEFDNKLKEQNNCCDVCKRVLVVPCQDHDHKTKNNRGILCKKCNSLLGYAEENLEILANAIKYLQKHADSSSIQAVCVEAENPLLVKR